MFKLLLKKIPDTYYNYLKIIVSCSLVFWIFKDVDLRLLGQQIANTSPLALLSYLLLSLLLVFLVSYRWSLLLINRPNLATILQFYKANISAQFYNLFLPTAYGGDLVKWTQLHSFNFSRKTLILSVVADRVIGLLGLITVGFFASLFAQLYQIASIPTMVNMLFYVLFTGVIIVFIFILSPLKLSSLPVVGRLTVLLKIENYLDTKIPKLLFLYFLAVVVQLLSFFSLYVLAVEAHLEIKFIYFLTISPVVSLISVLPISLAGFGTTEAAYLFFFEQLGAQKENILVFTSLFGLFKILLGGIGWLTEFVVASKSLIRVPIKH